jgi:hypothetical protein
LTVYSREFAKEKAERAADRIDGRRSKINTEDTESTEFTAKKGEARIPGKSRFLGQNPPSALQACFSATC